MNTAPKGYIKSFKYTHKKYHLGTKSIKRKVSRLPRVLFVAQLGSRVVANDDRKL